VKKKEKEKDKIRSKRVKEVQNRTELRQIRHDRGSKNDVLRKKEKFSFSEGGGTNIVFGPEYKRLIK
jgi:hypothetical protein